MHALYSIASPGHTSCINLPAPFHNRRSYKINTIFENGTNHNTEFLGFPKENDWVLYGGDPVDLTLGFRNWVAYNMARATGQYASRTKWVEVFLVDGDEPLSLADYNGIYIAEEKVKRVSVCCKRRWTGGEGACSGRPRAHRLKK